MRLNWKEVNEGTWEAKTDMGVFTIESGESGCKPGLGYFAFDVTKEDKHIAYAFDFEQAKRRARRKYKEMSNNNESALNKPAVVGRSEQLSCPRCRHTGIDTDKDGLNYCRSCSHYWRAT